MIRAFLLCLLLVPGFVLAEDENAPQFAEFEVLDITQDGKVSLAEAAGNEAVVVRFERADRNRDGKLTQAEYERLKKLKLRPAKPKTVAKAKAPPRTQTASR